MSLADPDFARHCCDLLAAVVGPCESRPMFGGWCISTGGHAFAIVASVPQGTSARLWLKAEGPVRSHYEAAGCQRFTYMSKTGERSINYYSAPEGALESPQLMAPWARQALDCALKAQSAREARPRPLTASRARPASPATRRAAAPAPKTRASRKSAKG